MSYIWGIYSIGLIKKKHSSACEVKACEETLCSHLGEPSPPSIHGQPSSGKSFKISITKQDDGGAPILEYIVKYRSVSIF